MERSTVVGLPAPDYEADDVLVVREPEQLRALGDDLRAKIVGILREHARSTTELADELGLPRGTVGHHVKVLEKAGLLRVVRTRQVRAVTERYYGRVARLFVLKSADADVARSLAASGLRAAADEILPSTDDAHTTFGLVHARLAPADAKRFVRRLDRLMDELRATERPDGELYGFAGAIYRTAVGE